jgi:hypothetical protein
MRRNIVFWVVSRGGILSPRARAAASPPPLLDTSGGYRKPHNINVFATFATVWKKSVKYRFWQGFGLPKNAKELQKNFKRTSKELSTNRDLLCPLKSDRGMPCRWYIICRLRDRFVPPMERDGGS